MKPKVPALDGVPDRVPVCDIVNPGGAGPVITDHAYGGVPPVAAKFWEYGAPTVPAGSVDCVVIDRAAGLIVRERAFVAVCEPLSET